MLFDVERARSIVQEYEQRVSVYNHQRALYAAQESQPNVLVRLIDQGLHLVDKVAMTSEHWRQNVTHSMRWLLATHNK